AVPCHRRLDLPSCARWYRVTQSRWACASGRARDRRTVKRQAPHAKDPRMTDERFFPSSGPLRLTDIASHVAAELSDLRAGEMMVHGVGSLDTAKSGE